MKKCVLFIFCAFLLLGGCGDDDSSTDASSSDVSATSLAGTYMRTAEITGTTYDVTLVATAAGGYGISLSGTGSAPEVSGSYTASGDTLTVTDESGGLACTGDMATGSYTYTVSATTLSLAVATDSCGGRRAVVEGDWTRQ